ncbi:MAG: GTPase HflX [Bacteroidales bacterium]|nr:GTPase HflX [Bacteroidales bacterium]
MVYQTYNDQIEKAVLVGVINQDQTREQVYEYLDELEFLAETAGVEPVRKFTQNLIVPNSRTYVGSGKLDEINNFIKDEEIKLVIFDDELSPTQLRNIENVLEVKVLDRTNLILDIFAQRARTAHAKTQVELAQYQYLLPRLTRMWTHLERQRGGIGMRGPGESQIETDRRIILEKISKLKEDLKLIDKQMIQQRKNRGQMIRVALVGYTNVGKSTIMNMLSKSDVLAEDKLFATLDTTVRKVVLDNLPFLLSDTVGFIRKLPHKLIESFKSTLDEARESDIIVHVVDVSHKTFQDQINVVDQTLKELKINDKPILMVFNKIDAFSFVQKDEDDLTPKSKDNYSLEELKNTYFAKASAPAVFISAKTNENVAEFRETLFGLVRKMHFERYPYNRI